MIPVTITKSDDGRTYTVEGFPQLGDNNQSASLSYQGSGTMMPAGSTYFVYQKIS